MIIHSEQEMLDFGESFTKQFVKTIPKSSNVIELVGDVGAGKTTFVRGLAKGLGLSEPITSPSFTISKQYSLPGSKRLVHYDFYRLSDPGLMSEDLQENLNDQNAIIIIEWGDSISNLLPSDHTKITIKYNNDNTRTVEL
ncbi:tRNA (adenosine(37)-N6)-threonylcarbamoyltransferase complex ATPase subunit type 1 TsaE [Candidatus Saccharibacteria bacterium]|nr:tRNA (adenosine(37)-N6)-threonylcarbamoyltransferase complex ATPase subunit type 1 TsaE [Candidatus Saccharibacteria bacterium]